METTTRVTNVEELRTPDVPSLKEMLLAPIDQRHLRSRVQGGKELDYYPIWTIVRCLIERSPDYKWEIVDVSQLGDYVVTKGRLSVYDEEGVEHVVENVASERLDSKGAPPVETCASSAFRRCAAMIGLGIGVYLDHL